MLKTLFKNTALYFFGLAFSKVVSLAVFILYARVLLPEGFGEYIFYLTLLQVVTFFADFGLNQWYQKNVDVLKKNEALSRVLQARVLTLSLSLVLSYFFLSLTSTFTAPLISLLFLATLIPEAFLSILDGFYLERGRPLPVVLKTASKMAVALLGYFFFRDNFSFTIAVYIYLFADLITLAWFFPIKFIKHLALYSFNAALKTLGSSFSYALLMSTSFLYARGDSLIIGYALPKAALGFYGAAYRYLESLSLLPSALAQNLFPISAKGAGISKAHLNKILLTTSLVGLVLSLAVFFASPFLITGLLGVEYISAIPILKIFSLVLLLFFINAPLATVIQSSSYLNKFLPYGFANTGLNLVLNFLLVPRYGIQSAAWVMLFTEVTGFVINLAFIKKIYD